jgi:hypothetical protein
MRRAEQPRSSESLLCESIEKFRAEQAEQLAHVAVLTGEQLGRPGLVELLVVLREGRADRQVAAEVVRRLLDHIQQRRHGADVQLDLDPFHAAGSGWTTAVRCHCCKAKT